MADILSQNQIDELLSGITSGEVKVDEEPEGKKIKKYDFRSPKKFTKEQLRTLDSLHENVARGISSYLASVLRSSCEIEILTIEEQRYYEYSNALPDNALIGMLEVMPKDKKIDNSTVLMDMSTNIAFMMIDRLLGGQGEEYPIKRTFTEIELAILKTVFDRFNYYIQEGWSDYIEVETRVDNIETNSRLVQAHSLEDIVVIVVMDIKLKDVEGKLNFCIPAINLEQMMGSFTSKYMRTVKKIDADKGEQRKHFIMDALVDSDLEMSAVLGKVELDLQTILGLRVNDVIMINKPANSNITIEVAETPWFEAKLGETKLKKAVQIRKLM